jgi:hypothetical protein
MDLLPVNAAHWHLVLNHLPVVGSLAALLLLGWALIRNTDDLKRAGLGALVLVALVTIPAFLTGEPSERHLQGLPGVSSRWMSNHEEIAEVALWVAVGVGAAALAALLVFRKSRSVPRWAVAGLLLLNLVVCGFMARTANYGGKIHHPEIRYSPAATAPTEGEH